MEKVTFENVQSLLDNGLTIDDIFDKKRKIQ